MYLNDWKDSGIEGMKKDFGINDAELEGATMLLASYGDEDYTGSAFVLFERGGKLYEVNGGHCSCYGLEDQWGPEETSLESLQHRLECGRLGQEDYCGNEFSEELRSVLHALEVRSA